MAISRETLEKFANADPADWGWYTKEMASRLLALEWSQITESNLPRVGDEVWGENSGIAMKMKIHKPEPMSIERESELWRWAGYTHRRPLNAPIAPAEGEK